MPTIMITGTNRGLGLEFVRQYLSEGWRILATARNPQKAKELQDLASKHADQLEIYPLEVKEFSQIEKLGRTLSSESIDVLLNNSGIYGGKQSLGEMDYESWKEVFLVNSMVPLKMAETFLPHIERGKKKSIVTITSKMGSISDNTSGRNYIYRSSKAAVNMVNKSLSEDLRSRGIIAVVLHPGWVRTDMGGEHAPLGVQESIQGMKKVIAGLTMKDTGKFFNYDGSEIPW